MLTLEEAQQEVLSRIEPLPAERVSLSASAGRILVQDILADTDLPPFDNSAMDGYAVRAEDLSGASADRPVPLQMVGHVPAGSLFRGTLSSGTCVRLFTGSPLPHGADAVVMQEDTEPDPAHASSRFIRTGVKPWENVRFKGEDIRKGELLIRAGALLTAAQIGALAATGRGTVEVHKQPAVGLIATGNELVEPGAPLGPGQLYESNRVCLATLAKRAGASCRVYPIVEDTLHSTETVLKQAFSECDAVVSSGGVSVGELDCVKAAFQQIGGALAFWKVAIKPGKPFALGQWQGKLFFGLPGNPVSSFVTFLLLVRPALLRLQGANEVSLPKRPGLLQEPIHNRGDRRHFVRVNLDPHGGVRPAGRQASHLLHSLAKANGLLDMPPESSLAAGTAVSVLTWD